MSRLLGGEADAFFRSYEQPQSCGLRLKRLKLSPGHPFMEKLTALFGLHPVPWCPEGYSYDDTVRPGRHIYHATSVATGCPVYPPVR